GGGRSARSRAHRRVLGAVRAQEDRAAAAAAARAQRGEEGRQRQDGRPQQRQEADGGGAQGGGAGSGRARAARQEQRRAARAARARVPIHTIAFSPTYERGPLLNLGEVSKRSNGTFRWARTADDLRAQIDTLTDELNKQYVLTFKLDLRSLEGKKFQLVSEDL